MGSLYHNPHGVPEIEDHVCGPRYFKLERLNSSDRRPARVAFQQRLAPRVFLPRRDLRRRLPGPQ